MYSIVLAIWHYQNFSLGGLIMIDSVDQLTGRIAGRWRCLPCPATGRLIPGACSSPHAGSKTLATNF
jgi:hypothetical protein